MPNACHILSAAREFDVREGQDGPRARQGRPRYGSLAAASRARDENPGGGPAAAQGEWARDT